LKRKFLTQKFIHYPENYFKRVVCAKTGKVKRKASKGCGKCKFKNECKIFKIAYMVRRLDI